MASVTVLMLVLAVTTTAVTAQQDGMEGVMHAAENGYEMMVGMQNGVGIMRDMAASHVGDIEAVMAKEMQYLMRDFDAMVMPSVDSMNTTVTDFLHGFRRILDKIYEAELVDCINSHHHLLKNVVDTIIHALKVCSEQLSDQHPEAMNSLDYVIKHFTDKSLEICGVVHDWHNCMLEPSDGCMHQAVAKQIPNMESWLSDMREHVNIVIGNTNEILSTLMMVALGEVEKIKMAVQQFATALCDCP